MEPASHQMYGANPIPQQQQQQYTLSYEQQQGQSSGSFPQNMSEQPPYTPEYLTTMQHSHAGNQKFHDSYHPNQQSQPASSFYPPSSSFQQQQYPTSVSYSQDGYQSQLHYAEIKADYPPRDEPTHSRRGRAEPLEQSARSRARSSGPGRSRSRGRDYTRDRRERSNRRFSRERSPRRISRDRSRFEDHRHELPLDDFHERSSSRSRRINSREREFDINDQRRRPDEARSSNRGRFDTERRRPKSPSRERWEEIDRKDRRFRRRSPDRRSPRGWCQGADQWVRCF